MIINITTNKFNKGLGTESGAGMDEENCYLQLIGYPTVKIKFEKWEQIGKKFCQNCPNLQKVWIPKELIKIEAPTIESAPFFGCNENLQIFTDITSENSIPEGWGLYWKNYAADKTLIVNYNANISQYESYKIVAVNR